jgi:Leucine-rich repeat (LRR) protein
LPVEASAWMSLEVLNLKNNKISDVGNLPAHWPQLLRLYLGTNLLQSMPFEIGTCVRLLEIDLSSNAIQTLPLSLANCTDLRRLHLGNNKVEYLPPEIFSALRNLTELHLYKNKLTVLPPEIGNLSSKRRQLSSSPPNSS